LTQRDNHSLFGSGVRALTSFIRSRWSPAAADHNAKRFVLDILSTLGPGVPAKVAQLLSQHQPELRTDLGTDLSDLRIPADEVQQWLRRDHSELMKQIQTLKEAAAQGSLGQVHEATLHNGQKIAVKVQYPDMQAAVRRQLDLMFGAAGFFSKFKSADFSIASYRSFFETKLAEEIDYRCELAAQDRFKKFFLRHPAIEIPGVWTELSDSTVLVQDWIPHLPLAMASFRSEIERRQLAHHLVQAFIAQVFQFYEVHSDLHLGNIGLSPQQPGAIVLYDFGSTLRLSPAAVTAFAETIQQRWRNAAVDPLHFFDQLGFDRTGLDGMELLLRNQIDLMFESFLNHTSFDPSSWDFGSRSAAILGPARIRFRMAGPPWFLLFMRTYSGLVGCLKTLQVSVNWREIFEAIVTTQLTQSTPSAQSKLKVSAQIPQSSARRLMIQVFENGEQTVRLEMPPGAVENLALLVPERAQAWLVENGQDLSAISAKAIASGLAPQVLFEATIGTRVVKAWLD
jgi:predicted unusual protein kinase regulating ubiquinone biosynthesis (AarF/ABC1/UbiB family)